MTDEDEIHKQLQAKLPIRSGKNFERDQELLEILARLILRTAKTDDEVNFLVHGVWGHRP